MGPSWISEQQGLVEFGQETSRTILALILEEAWRVAKRSGSEARWPGFPILLLSHPQFP